MGMNFWQYKFNSNMWHNWKTISVGDIEEWKAKKTVNKEPNDIKIGDLVFLYRAGSSLNKKYKGIYLLAKVVDVNFEYEYPVDLEIIEDFRNNIFKPENFGFNDIVKKIDKLSQNGTYYKFLSEDNPYDIYNSLMNYKNSYNLLDNTKKSKVQETEKDNLIKSRLGQGSFRKDLVNYWKGCSVTGIKQVDILIASHIKPWKDATDEERLDSFNGLLLIPTLDKLFDKGYISFDESGKIIISSFLENASLLGVSKDMKINISGRHQKYLQFHRRVFELPN